MHTFVYYRVEALMKTSEFKRWLQSRGARFVEGSLHTKVYCNGRQSTLPRHTGELPEGLRKAIMKQLNLAPDR